MAKNEQFLYDDIPDDELFCDVCGLTYKEFLQTGVYRCENCYRVFKARTVKILKSKIEKDVKERKVLTRKISTNNLASKEKNKEVKEKIDSLEKLLLLAKQLGEEDKVVKIQSEIDRLKKMIINELEK